LKITHLFESPKADGDDETVVCPSDWNDEHVIELVQIHLAKSSATENIGGSNGTKQQIAWDSELRKDTGFTHSNVTNNSRIQVDADGRYRVRATVSGLNSGTNRITNMLYIRVNGSTEIKRCVARNYSRGSSYNDMSMNINTDIDLNNGDYIEIQTEVDDADATYTVTTYTDQCECIVERVE
jgi:hypothetical protein